ncbi:hypothetical protein [Mangrovimonas aestuarii]|uniref:hypothetical protein n=1 Tax=Mangrovimonas aestuarii TaxID=3018443 RepID=UPI00237963C4|nr:hypothetical protein [Mangrovimonas aestuarii]
MEKRDVIVSERRKPLLYRVISALLFTIGFGLLIYYFIYTNWVHNDYRVDASVIRVVIGALGLGAFFGHTRCVFIDLKEHKFRETIAIGPLKFGTWKTINNPEYISVFRQPLVTGEHIFEVNLWYDRNKHWQLYEKPYSSEAFEIGYEISEQLKIDLLDATDPHNRKWVDKESFKLTGELTYFS